uniref:Variant surface glycoprotein 1125.1219 n=1 Tax=Trypanosoma brucei TaxID=5691 RepID=A0A1J0R6Q0_9TRYP|nr:variant surface glycoprotein 1125.1219 [Trypanosoma brucei]
MYCLGTSQATTSEATLQGQYPKRITTRLTITALLGAALLIQPVNMATTTLSHNATSWCHEYHYLKAVIEATKSELTARIQDLKQDQEQQMVCNLASADEQTKGSGKAMQILSLATAGLADQHIQGVSTFINNVQLPLKYLQTRINIYEGMETAAMMFRFTAGSGTHGDGNATSTQCTIPLTFGTTQANLCSERPACATVEAVKAQLKKFTKVKTIQKTAPPDLIKHSGIATRAQAGNWANSGTEAGGCGTNFKIPGRPTVTPTGSTISGDTALPDNFNNYPSSEADAADQKKHRNDKLLAVYKKLKEAFANKPLKLTDITLAQIKMLARKSAVDAALLDPLCKFGKPWSETSNSKLDAEMDRIYSSGTDFKTNFIDNAKTIKIKIIDEAGSEPMELQHIVPKNEVPKALAYLNKHQLKTELAEKSAATTAAATSASQTCQTKIKKGGLQRQRWL